MYTFSKLCHGKPVFFLQKERSKEIILSNYECILDHLSTEKTKDLGKHSSLIQEYRIPRSNRHVKRRNAKVKQEIQFKSLGTTFPRCDPVKFNQQGYTLPNCFAAVALQVLICCALLLSTEGTLFHLDTGYKTKHKYSKFGALLKKNHLLKLF